MRMKPRTHFGLAGMLLLAPVWSAAAEPELEGLAFFESKIRPVLVEHCYQCHSLKAEKNGAL